MTTFADLGLPTSIAASLERDGITTPFPIQAATIPDALAGRDVCGRAPTGSGKTLAFGLPILATVARSQPRKPRALVLVPTRELADQIRTQLTPAARAVERRMLTVYGGVGYGGQRSALRSGVDVLVACPGRLEDLVASGDVDLSEIDVVAIDEADRMADMGFLPAVKRLLDRTPSDRQTLLFSATLDGDVATLTSRYQRNPVRHESEVQEDRSSEATHHFWRVERNDRLPHAASLIRVGSPTIVFTRTRHGADRLAKQLDRMGVNAVAMHGGKSQPQRTKALAAFTARRAQALIATDVAARGIHVDDVATVLHFDPPEDEKAYVHRSGRTARAGATGAVHSFVDGSQIRDTKRLIRSLELRAEIEHPGSADEHVERVATAAPAPRAERASAPRAERRPAPRPRDEGTGRAGDVEGNVYVANLPFTATSGDLARLFGRYGPVEDATIVTHKGSDKSRGFGFVSMTDPARAIGELHGAELGGRMLTVREARPRR